MTTTSLTATAFEEMRQRFTEEYFFALERKAGGHDALLKMTAGKPRGQVEAIVDSFFPETEASAGLLNQACRCLLDWEALFDGLQALPCGETA